jgi:hypothetical protein
MFRRSCWIALVVLTTWSRAEAAAFKNLNFESCSTTGLGNFPVFGETIPAVPVSTGLPGWKVTIGSAVQDYVAYNCWMLDYPTVIVTGPASGQGPGLPIAGQYSLSLQATTLPANDLNGPPIRASLSQTGTVPADAQSLVFVWDNGFAGFPSSYPSRCDVYINGAPLALTALASSGGRTTWAGDVSAWQGGTVDLMFALDPPAVPVGGGRESWGSIDSIAFSSTIITPEPGTLGLLALGGAALLVLRRRGDTA